ncbi:MAG: hypothetical protein KME27_10845 [Lyngbya sp. HA4199-MV5]|jgi:hypothetical protein|nr:hypothetical protein [Lyngbya sp. HA4199-MV5]
MHAPTPAERAALIAPHLGVSRPFSAAGSSLIDQIREPLFEAQSLDPAEEARLLAALSVQIAGRLAALHGCR